MSGPKKAVVLSASSVKQFLDCSWLFYQTRNLKVPDNTHPKTKLGTLAHAILEALCKEKHHTHYQTVMLNQSVYDCAPINRMVRMFRAKNPDVTDEIMADLDKLVFVALNHDFACKGAKKVLAPEHPFEITFEEGFSIRGFMDRVVLYDNVAVIRDYKTQGKRFTEDQMADNLQAWFYQLAVKHEFDLPAKVEFLLLRFPANSRDSQRYLQSVPPMTENEIEAFKWRLYYIGQEIEGLTLEKAKGNLKAYTDNGFCVRVCSLKDPFDYWVVLEEGKERPVRSVRIPPYLTGSVTDPLAWATEELRPQGGQIVEQRRYAGCHAFWNERGQRRSFQ